MHTCVNQGDEDVQNWYGHDSAPPWPTHRFCATRNMQYILQVNNSANQNAW
jgi:hypothetical protein